MFGATKFAVKCRSERKEQTIPRHTYNFKIVHPVNLALELSVGWCDGIKQVQIAGKYQAILYFLEFLLVELAEVAIESRAIYALAQRRRRQLHTFQNEFDGRQK